jgi:hypothetical protein
VVGREFSVGIVPRYAARRGDYNQEYRLHEQMRRSLKRSNQARDCIFKQNMGKMFLSGFLPLNDIKRSYLLVARS